MKKLLVIAFMIAGTATFAQLNGGSGESKILMDNAKMIEMQSQRMKTNLGLNDNQTTQIKALLTKQVQDREAKMVELKALKANGQQLTDAQKDDIKAKMDADRIAMDTQLKNILTPQQYTQWQSNKEAAKAKFVNSVQKPTTAG